MITIEENMRLRFFTVHCTSILRPNTCYLGPLWSKLSNKYIVLTELSIKKHQMFNVVT